MRTARFTGIRALVFISLATMASADPPVELDGWIASAPPAKGTKAWFKANNDFEEWAVSIREGRPIARAHYPYRGGKNRKADPLPFEPPQGTANEGLYGHRYAAKVSDGWIVAFNAGEFGAGLWWFSPDGKRHEKLGEFWIKQLIPTEAGLLALEGIAHGSISKGHFIRIAKKNGGGWGAEEIVDLKAAPEVGMLAPDGSVIVATTKRLLKIDPKTAKVDVLVADAFWGGLYSNSIALAPDGGIYLGMRHGVAMIRPKGKGREVRWLRPPTGVEGPHTFDGKHDISTIDLTVVYLVPKDRTALEDWRERLDYYTKRIAKFHERESSGKSSLKVRVHPEPLVVEKTAEEIRGKNANQTFFNSTNAAKEALKWPPKERGEGFPIILVMSEINWRELDDFTRTRLIDGKATHEGNISAEGRHFPGAESGGARAYYDAGQGLGVGLVSADGWRVPYSGSDCVVYHEGVGHAIGLPHPEPGDDSVMCFAQYHYWINETWVTPSQKNALGWPGGDEKAPPDRSGTTDLFTAFTALQDPITPKPGEPVRLKLTWPKGAKVRSMKVRVQTEVRGPWRTVKDGIKGEPLATIDIGDFAKATPVSYRLDAALEDGQEVELRGYFQVREAK